MEHEFRDGRLVLRRAPEQKSALLTRLRRIEGQVRGLQQMVEEDRHCLDMVQQANAVTAATRQVALLVIQDHLAAAVEQAVTSGGGDAPVKEMVKEMMGVLQAGLRQ